MSEKKAKKVSRSRNGAIHVVYCDIKPTHLAAPHELRPVVRTSVARILHGNDMTGTNPVAVVSGRLCPRKKGCQWCAGLRDRIRSRTIR